MFAPATDHPVGTPVWTGLGKDVEGLCSVCHHRKTLEIQHIPTDAWLCRPCFAAYWKVADAPADWK